MQELDEDGDFKNDPKPEFSGNQVEKLVLFE